MSRMRRGPASPLRRVGDWLAGALLSIAACGTPAEPEKQALTVPSCATVTRFGNGQRCDGAPSLAVCGAGTAALCASDWLCFDAPERAFCACASDADCEGRAVYINAARAKAKIAPLAAKCSGGRCSGAP